MVSGTQDNFFPETTLPSLYDKKLAPLTESKFTLLSQSEILFWRS